MFLFNRRYFLFAILLFLTEVCIALFVNDGIVRPYLGDYLVVILIYCTIKTVVNTAPLPTAIGVLLFAYSIELLQYLNLLAFLGLQQNKLANVILGNRFEWIDIIAYTLGVATVLLIEFFKPKQQDLVTDRSRSRR